ncbi:CRISPR-associated endonuclease Cas1 [Caldisericum sp.]|uniref:CRISPR-associated endonuclease Cas1 n=1 Tax=Caldisericum sp. TaxID=2499687 RepID=UPI003D10C87C
MELYINTPGTYVHVKDQMFEVRTPADDDSNTCKKAHFAASKVKSLILSKSAALSTDAVFLAIENNVDILFVKSDGFPVGRVWHSKHGSTSKIRKAQLEASLNQIGLEFVLKWVTQKIKNQESLLGNLKKHRQDKAKLIDESIIILQNYRKKLSQFKASCTDDIADSIRGIEGNCGRIYFDMLSQLIPPKYKFNGRSMRPAMDAFNAFLNYCYGILYGKVEKSLIIAGIDPFVGFLHRDDYNQKSMVFDFIEPYRTYADEIVFKFFSTKQVRDSHYETAIHGVFLQKEGKKAIIEAFNYFMDTQKILHNGRKITRVHSLQLDAHAFANSLLESVRK